MGTLSSGIKLLHPSPSSGLSRTSIMSKTPALSILWRAAPTLTTEPLTVTIAIIPFKKEAMEMQRSPALECPSSPIPGPLT
uniref:Uncharacterized protein n=1 Tax=Anolis carolinensis TaxID=28377 RepID=A0A803TF40_ANOCA